MINVDRVSHRVIVHHASAVNITTPTGGVIPAGSVVQITSPDGGEVCCSCRHL